MQPHIADAVVPIAYSPKSGRHGQHHYNLRAYKGEPSSTQARWSLLALLLLFLHEHMDCLGRAIGGRPTHAVTVPSTRGRPGSHPLSNLIGDRLGLPKLDATPTLAYQPDERVPHVDWFTVSPFETGTPARILLIDDTWTSGARTQSLAYALKQAGATSVAIVVLGRHVNPADPRSAGLLNAIRDPLFDTGRCALDDLPGSPIR